MRSWKSIVITLGTALLIAGCSSAAAPSQQAISGTLKPAAAPSMASNASPAPAGAASPAPATDPLSAQSTQTGIKGILTVTFIDVGQGASQFIVSPSGKTMLIDGGNNNQEKKLVQFFKDRQVKKIDILIGTHPDADHIGGLDAVVNNLEIGSVYMPKVPANTQTFESLLTSIQKKGLKVITAKAGVSLDLGEGVKTDMIAPVKTYPSDNDMSAVVRMAYGDNSFLFTGDAEGLSESDILASGATLKSDVLLVGHHGSKSSTSEAFLNAVSPKYGVIQVGKNNYGHPFQGSLDNLQKHHVQIFRNDTDGTVEFTSDGKNLAVNKSPSVYAGSPNAPPPEATQETPKSVPAAAPAAAPVIAGGLVVSAASSNPAPKQNGHETVTVIVKDTDGNPVNGANVNIVCHYKSKDTPYSGVTDANGTASIPFGIGRAASGFVVHVDVQVTAGDAAASAKTSFTPQ